MYLFELNIGLNVAEGASSPMAVQARYEIVKVLMAEGLNSCKGVGLRSVFSEYIGPDGAVGESTAVALVTADSVMDAQDFADMLARVLLQDCVALFQPPAGEGLEGRGWLIGPKADKWGGFCLDYFVRF